MTENETIRRIAGATLHLPNPEAFRAIQAELKALKGNKRKNWRLRDRIWAERKRTSNAANAE